MRANDIRVNPDDPARRFALFSNFIQGSKFKNSPKHVQEAIKQKIDEKVEDLAKTYSPKMSDITLSGFFKSAAVGLSHAILSVMSGLGALYVMNSFALDVFEAKWGKAAARIGVVVVVAASVIYALWDAIKYGVKYAPLVSKVKSEAKTIIKEELDRAA